MKLAVWTALSAILLLGGCAAPVPVGFQNFQQREMALAAFQSGDARLMCQTAQCLALWNGARPAVARAASAGVWDDVAADVLAANYNQDLGWYYLGAAAAALGYETPARIYFERAIEASLAGGAQTCNPVACDGWNLPGDARNAMASLTPISTRAVRRRPAPRRAAPAAASSNWVSPTTGAASPSTGASGSGAGWVSPVQGGGAAAPSGGGGWVTPVPSHQ